MLSTVSAKSPTSSSAAFLPAGDGLEPSTLVCPGPIVVKLHAERGSRSTDSPIPAALSKSYPILFLQSQKHISVWSARRRPCQKCTQAPVSFHVAHQEAPVAADLATGNSGGLGS